MFLAKFISYLFNPFIWPTIIFALLFWVAPGVIPGMANQNILLLLIFSGSFLVPLFMILTLRNSGVISSVEMGDRKERYLPMLLTSILYFGFTWMLFQKTPQLVHWTILGISLVLAGIFLLNFILKLSAHVVAATGSGFFIALLGIKHDAEMLVIAGVLLIVLAGLVAWARLYLKAHTHREVWVAMVFGLISSFGILLIP